MRNLTCIICPVGCSLDIDDSGGIDNLSIKGNRCSRGAVYAQEEIRAPKRIVTATVQILMPQNKGDKKTSMDFSIRRIPVKTTIPCLREKIPALLRDIYKIEASLPVKAGDVLISGWNGEEIDVIATRTVGN